MHLVANQVQQNLAYLVADQACYSLTHLVADQAAERAAKLLGDARGRGDRRNAPRLRDADAPAALRERSTAVARLQQELRDLQVVAGMVGDVNVLRDSQ